MKKIPTLFKRIFENHKIVGITDEVIEGIGTKVHMKMFWHGNLCRNRGRDNSHEE